MFGFTIKHNHELGVLMIYRTPVVKSYRPLEPGWMLKCEARTPKGLVVRQAAARLLSGGRADRLYSSVKGAKVPRVINQPRPVGCAGS